MKWIKLYEDFRNHFISGYLYHYTLEDNLDSILTEGIRAKKNPYYPNGSKAVFLTNKNVWHKANLPFNIEQEMDEYYNYKEQYENPPIVKLTIDANKLDVDKFYPDDDYIANRYKWNKAKTFEKKLEESLTLWGSIAYLDDIDIVNI